MSEFIEKYLLNILKHYITGDRNYICNYVKKAKITVAKLKWKQLEAYTCTRRYFTNDYNPSIWYTIGRRYRRKKNAISVLKLSRPKSYSLWTHRVVTKVLTVSALDIGQHRQWSTGQYAVAIAEHYSRTINYVF